MSNSPAVVSLTTSPPSDPSSGRGPGTLSSQEVHASTERVTRVFDGQGKSASVHALGPIDIELRKGEFFSVIGPSGCGKSTLLEVVAGLSPATEGKVTFEGKPIEGRVPDGIGVVFQEDASFPWLTVEKNLWFGLKHLGVGRAEARRRIDDALGLMGLRDFAHHYPAQLSGGMRQRVCIARTLVLKPRLILLDEPFGALDQQTRLLMGDEVLRLWRETGATIFLITHALDEATMLSDRVGVMSARPGRFLEIIETQWPRDPRQPHRRSSRFLAGSPRVCGRCWRQESIKSLGYATERR